MLVFLGFVAILLLVLLWMPNDFIYPKGGPIRFLWGCFNYLTDTQPLGAPRPPSTVTVHYPALIATILCTMLDAGTYIFILRFALRRPAVPKAARSSLSSL